MSAFTIRYREMPGDAEREAVERIAQRCGARTSWRANSRFPRAYALIEGDAVDVDAIRKATRGSVLDGAVIALALWPNVAEALPALEDALGGPGRPVGVLACEREGDGIGVEWNLDRTGADVVLGLIEVELQRFHASRVTELLAPMPLAWWASLAAQGLRAPQIAPDRVLEALLEQVDVAG